MENDKINQILKKYLEITAKSPTEINPREIEILQNFLKDYGYEETLEILTFFKNYYQPKKNLKAQISQLLSTSKMYFDSKKVFEKEEKITENKKEDTIYVSQDVLNVIIKKFNLQPKKDILNILDENLKKFYISELVYLKVWENLTQEERKDYIRKAMAFVKNLNINDKKKLKEALHYRIKYLIKKDYNVLL